MSERKLAVVVGCARFQSKAIKDLKYSENDARAVYAKLTDPAIGGYSEENTRLLLSNPYQIVTTTIQDVLQDARPADTVLVYFAGHGLRDEQGELCIAATDTYIEHLRYSSVRSDDIRHEIRNCRCKRICLILDCCFAGAFGSEGRAVLTSEDVSAGVDKLAGEGTVILTSSQSTEESREVGKLGHGLFTYHLLNGLDGGADADGDGLITPYELFKYISLKMDDQVGRHQHPLFKGEIAGEFHIVRNPRKEVLAELRDEVESLRKSKRYIAALETIERGYEKFRDTPLQGSLDELREETEKAMRREREEFGRRLLEVAGGSEAKERVYLAVMSVLRRDPQALFCDTSETKSEMLLQQCFKGEMTVEALVRLWEEGEEPAPSVPQPSLDELRQEVGALTGEFRHDAALKTIEQRRDDFRDTALQGSVGALWAETRQQMKELLEKFEKRLEESVGDSETRKQAHSEASELLKGNPHAIFRGAPDSQSAQLLRKCFIGQMSPDAMWSQWGGEQRDSERQPGLWQSRFRVIVALMLFPAALAATFWLWWVFNPPPTVLKEPLRMGVLAKKKGSEGREAVARDFNNLLATVNENLGSKAGFEFGVDNVIVYSKLDDLLEGLEQRTISVAGELSPRAMYLAYTGHEAKPFIGPQYGGKSEYAAILFGLDDGPYGSRNPDAFDDLVKDLCNPELTEGTVSRLAVSGPDSTSGYWYPRWQVLPVMKDHKCPRDWNDLILEIPDSSQILSDVCHGVDNVVAGAIADFRFESECSDGAGRLVEITQTEPIPQGAFVMANDVGLTRRQLGSLQNQWIKAVREMYLEGLLTPSASAYLPEKWGKVSLRRYKSSFTDVFEAKGLSETERGDSQRKLAVIIAVILTSVSILFLFAIRHDSSRPQPGTFGAGSRR